MTARLKDAFVTALIAGFLPCLSPACGRPNAGRWAVEWRLLDVGAAPALIFFGRLALGLIRDGYGKLIAPVALVFGLIALALPFPSQFLHSVAVIGSFVIATHAVDVLIKTASFRRKPEFSWHLRQHVCIRFWRRVWIPAFAGMTHLKKLGAISTPQPALTAVAVVFPFTPLASRYALDVAVMVLTYVMLAWGLTSPWVMPASSISVMPAFTRSAPIATLCWRPRSVSVSGRRRRSVPRLPSPPR